MEKPITLESLERIETCFALLHRSAREVYKRRKPIRLRLGDETLDLSSVDARRKACEEEERIDRRLAPDVTLGVVPITRDEHGEARVRGDGSPVDWALAMRRLPDADRADRRLAEGELDDDHLRTVAHRLAAFHERAREAASDSDDAILDGFRARIGVRIEAPDLSEGAASKRPLPPEAARAESWQRACLETEADRFLRRARGDAICESHGELALDHVFVDASGEVRILAGLEMGPQFRDSDVAADIALLATDLAARHRADLAERFVAEYARIANDFDFYPLLDFYSSLRASLRGKLDWHCAERLSKSPQRARFHRERAHRFFALALAAPRRPLLPPTVVAMGGQVASGKSTVARHIAQRIGAPVVGSDPTRDFLLGARVNEDLHEARWEESYAPGFADRVYAEVLRRAGEVLASGRPVVIDGCFRSRAQREQARALAKRFGHPFFFVEAQVSREVQRDRLAERAVRDSVPLEAWTEIADSMRAGWEPADELEKDEHVPLDTSFPLEHNAETLEARLPTWPDGLTG